MAEVATPALVAPAISRPHKRQSPEHAFARPGDGGRRFMASGYALVVVVYFGAFWAGASPPELLK